MYEGWNNRMVELAGTTVKEVACEKCRTKYAFVVNRKVQGFGTSLYNADDDGAHDRATANAQKYLKHSLENAVELAPCPNCGAYQADMVASLKSAHLKWLLIPAAGLFLAGILSVFLGCVNSSTFTMLFAGACFVIGVGLILYRLQAAASFDPNAGDPKARIEAGRELALFKKDGST